METVDKNEIVTRGILDIVLKEALAAQAKSITEDIKQHMSALGEEYQSRLEGVSEQIGGLMEDVITLKEDMKVVKDDIREIKTVLTTKVNYKEFIDHEKRISELEDPF